MSHFFKNSSNNVDNDKYNVLVLDCNKDFEHHPKIFDMYDKFKKFIMTIEPYNFVNHLLQK